MTEIDELRRCQALAREMGGAGRVAPQRERGKLTVRERVAALSTPSVQAGITPGGTLLCLAMAAPVAIDVAGQALRGQVLPLTILAGYAGVCTLVYFSHALRHSALRHQGDER